jgi:hypothetical protein
VRKNACIRILIVATAFLFSRLPAQHLTLTVDRDTISINEFAEVKVTGELDDLYTDAVLEPTEGYFFSRRSVNSFFNGKSQFITLTYTLQPITSGTYTIGPAYLQDGSKRIFSNKVTITILPDENTSKGQFLFLRCETPRKKFYVGEQVPLTIRVYSRINAWSASGERPSANYFSNFLYASGPYPLDENIPDTVVTWHGYKYLGKAIYREFLYPNTAGKLIIPSYRFECSYRQAPFPTGNDVVDDQNAVNTPVELRSEEVTLDVLSLPDKNKPADFSGDVGLYSLNATVDRTDVKAGEAVKLNVRVGGKGNIGFLQLHLPAFPDNVQVFSPSTTDSIHTSSGGISGEKTFTITLIPGKEGKYTIPGISFSYFDVSKKEYVTLTTPDFQLNVSKAETSGEENENNLPDGFLSATTPLQQIGRFLLILIPPVLLVFVLLAWRKRKKRLAAEKTSVEISENEIPSQKPGSKVPFLASNAFQLLEQQNFRGALYIAYEALITACCEKCELGREEASMNQVRYRLGIKSIGENDIAMITGLLDKLSALRFSAGSVSMQETRAVLNEMQIAIQKLGF